MLTEEEYARLMRMQSAAVSTPSPQSPMTALEYLLALPPGTSSAADLRARMEEERNAWDAA